MSLVAAAALRRKFMDPQAGVVVVAHRGAHNPSPRHGLGPAPENSLLALERCVALGVDMMEADVHPTADGGLVILHDPTVDRTTEGSGPVTALTLAQATALRLRQNSGGAMYPMLTEQRLPSLDALLEAARGRILLNLDMEEKLLPQVVARVHQAGMGDQVLVKAAVTESGPALADRFEGVMFMPMIGAKGEAPGLLTTQQAAGVRPVPAVELLMLQEQEFFAVRAAAGAKIRVWANTLTEVGVLGVVGIGGDIDSLRDPEAGWGELLRAGVSVIQTDEPALLLDYLASRQTR